VKRNHRRRNLPSIAIGVMLAGCLVVNACWLGILAAVIVWGAR
jgi:hypothetical protein